MLLLKEKIPLRKKYNLIGEYAWIENIIASKGTNKQIIFVFRRWKVQNRYCRLCVYGSLLDLKFESPVKRFHKSSWILHLFLQ